MEILTVKNLSFAYPEADEYAVNDLSLSINEGEFFVLLGKSGCGKSTLLRHMKPRLAPHGSICGEIFFKGRSLTTLSERDAASKIGFVMQSPENGIVTDKVWHELAFGLESLGYDNSTIRRRVAEMAAFFGIENWFYKDVSELSGGQKQLLNLASVMVMQPELLILDEPTSQLDPIAASEFLTTLKKINRELGTTVILSEHRLEEALPLATRTAVMDAGKLLCCGSITEVGAYLKEHKHSMFLGMPAAMQIWGSVLSSAPCPVSVNEGREFLNSYVSNYGAQSIESKTTSKSIGKVKISASDVWFKYEKNFPNVMKGVKLSAYSGEILCILGGNGSGKTTTLKVLSGLKKPYRGSVKAEGKIGYLPQNPQTMFVKKTVYENLYYAVSDRKTSKDEKKERIEEIIKLCRLSGLEKRHPYDLSGGEQQRTAMAEILLSEPDILLLDEPTKGLDAHFKREFADILKSLTEAGVCIIIVSHDIEFCALYADRCALFFDGNIVAEGTPTEFFSGNSFYTTAANRISRGIIPNAVTANDVISAIDGKADPKYERDLPAYKKSVPTVKNKKTQQGKSMPLWRKICAAASALISSLIFIYTVKTDTLSQMIDRNGLTALGKDQLYIYGIFILFLTLTAILVVRKTPHDAALRTPSDNRKLSRRTLAAVFIIILLIPLTLFVGVVYIERKQYYITAAAVLIECMLPFFMVFEGKRPRARELVIISVLCALSIAGRAAFFMLPQFKPVLAMTIIAGVAFGGETGFLVGSLTMLVSNILFSQGPWTPWQMFAAGIIGFLAGMLYRKGFLRRTKASLCTFGALSTVLIYGGIMNPASALMWGSESLNLKMIMTYYLTGFPMDCVHGAATVVFLLFLSEPMLEKLDRIKVKYGLIE